LNPEGWSALVESGLDLSTTELRLAYGLGFLEATRSLQHRFQLIGGPEEVGSFEGLTSQQRGELEAARERIVPPILSISEGPPWVVRVYLIEDYDLLRVHVKFDASGRIERHDVVLQENLPLPLAI